MNLQGQRIENSNFYLQMLFVTTSDKDLYHVLYPQGWCIVPTMETIHHQLWLGAVKEILHLDSLGRILVQLIIIFQVIRVMEIMRLKIFIIVG